MKFTDTSASKLQNVGKKAEMRRLLKENTLQSLADYTKNQRDQLRVISKVETHVNKTLSKVELATRSSQDPFMRTRRGKKGGI